MTVVVILESCLCNCSVVNSFLSFVFDWLCTLSISLQFLIKRWLHLLIAGLKMKNSLTKWQSPPQNSRDKSFFLGKLTGFAPQFSMVDHTLFCSVCSSAHLLICLPCSVAQFHLVPLDFTAPFGRPSGRRLRPPSNFFVHSLFARSVQDTTPEYVLSLCWCSLILTLTTSMGIWHSAGATKSWSSLVSWSCSWWTSRCIRSNYHSGGWAIRIIHFSSLVFSSLSITLTRQKTISLAIRNHSFRYPIEGRLTFRDISPVAIRTKRLNLLQSTVHRIHSWAKSKALAVSERSQRYLPNHSKYMR